MKAIAQANYMFILKLYSQKPKTSPNYAPKNLSFEFWCITSSTTVKYLRLTIDQKMKTF